MISNNLSAANEIQISINCKTKNKPLFFNELTGVRAVAAFLVFFHHFNIFADRKSGEFAYGIMNEFHIGVAMFFVLSGFLITYRYYDAVKIRNSRWVIDFVKNRFARIYPMFFIVTIITFSVIFYKSGFSKHNILLLLSNLTFVKGFFHELKFTGVLQSWSLTVEECFYFSAPLIFVLSRKIKPFYLYVATLTAGFFLVFVFNHLYFYKFFGDFKFMLIYTYFGRSFEFFVGIYLALIFKKEINIPFIPDKYRTIIGSAIIVFCIIGLVLVKGDTRFGVHTPPGIFINNFILPIGIALFYLGLISENTVMKKILSSNIFVLLGKASFTFYLIHLGLLSSLVLHFYHSYLLLFIVAVLLSIILYKTIEEPAYRFIKNVGNK